MRKLILFFLLFICYCALSQPSNTWVWTGGSNLPDQTTVYGTMGVANATNMPGGRYNSSSWVLNDKLYFMGGVNEASTYKSDLWEYNTISKNWTWLKGSDLSNQFGNYGIQGTEASTNTPGARKSFNTWVFNNKLYLFGGYGAGATGFGFLNDLWVNNPATNNWTWLKGSKNFQVGVYGTMGIANVNNTPYGKDGAISWVANNKLYLFGGRGYGSDNLLASQNDLWEYDPATNNWRWLSGATIGGAEGVYGAKGVEANTNMPGCRMNSVSWSFTNKLFLMGGHGKAVGSNINYLNDFWQYDLTSNNWTWLKGSNSSGVAGGTYGQLGVEDPNNTPGPREYHLGWANNNKFYLYGGFGRVSGPIAPGILSDMWEYNPLTNNWLWKSGPQNINISPIYGAKDVFDTNNNPGLRYQSMGWSYNNYFYLFGGFDFNTAKTTNDLWKINQLCSEMNSIKDGNWSDAAVWSCNRLPLATESIKINNHIIDLTGNGYAKEIIYNPTGTVRLGVGGNLVLNQ